uniref:Uncharacterized protein n=1 Tax=Stomoxys calcitrans TaxID=35570 RepID=A0A1I8NRZ5_STOCA
MSINMERKNQNFEFIAKLSASSEKFDALGRPLPNLILTQETKGNESPICGTPTCNSASLAYPQTDTEEDIYDEVAEETESDVKSFDNSDEDSVEDDSHYIEANTPRRMNSKLRTELLNYKQELKQYKNTTKELESKYMKISSELSEMQTKHQQFMAQRPVGEGGDSNADGEVDDNSCSDDSSAISLRRKSTQIFHRGSSFRREVPLAESHTNCKPSNKQRFSAAPKRQTMENKENLPPTGNLKTTLKKSPKKSLDSQTLYKKPKTMPNVELLQTTIEVLQSEKSQFRNIIEEQQHCLQDYHQRCVKAQRVMKTQQIEIEKLNSNNKHLEHEITQGIDQLRSKIEAKLREISQLPQMMRQEQMKNKKLLAANVSLNERLRIIQNEANQMRKKIDEINRRKTSIVSRLKTAERDLKIFKNYNVALKHEKRRLNEDLQKLRDQMSSLEISGKRNINRQREQSDKQKRDLQKRIFDLEFKLNRSQTSTNSLVQERDNLITELQTQLNTLVHNFEVSQKHIRVLRRHISTSMCGGNAREAVARNRVLNETA